MSARSLLLWVVAGSVGLWGAMALLEPEAPVSTLEEGLGPAVTIQPI